ncbi:MAG: WbqC family protein [Taibaiella sp.]|nr:WbqC family protein [Taibaiella sp.]
MIVSPFIPFPDITWWAVTDNADTIMLDTTEHFEKMTSRNRYRIAGANGSIQLTIPLQQGRDQRAAMKDIIIDNKEKWQQRHWRTITSAYRRSPYFEHYEPALQLLFTKEYQRLTEYNYATIEWLSEQLHVNHSMQVTTEYHKKYGAGITDIRAKKIKLSQLTFPHYYQLFEDRNGFIPDLSVLDLLFSEGPYTMDWIRANKSVILSGNL